MQSRATDEGTIRFISKTLELIESLLERISRNQSIGFTMYVQM